MNKEIEMGLFVLMVLVLSPFVAYALSTFDVFWTRLESGSIKFIKRGDSLHEIIYNTPGFELIEGENGKEFVKTTKKQSKPWFGLYWIGLPPFARIHKFKITKETENPEGEKPADWILGKEKGEVEVDNLRFIFPRPYLLRDVELKDRVPVNVLAVAKFQVVRPYVPVFFFKNAMKSLVSIGSSSSPTIPNPN